MQENRTSSGVFQARSLKNQRLQLEQSLVILMCPILIHRTQTSLYPFKSGIHVFIHFNISWSRTLQSNYQQVNNHYKLVSHIRNADGAYLVYDITSEASFKALDFWYDSIRKATSDDIIIYLIGNKNDLADEDEGNRKVQRHKALEFTRKYDIQGYAECSAKDGTNVVETFESFYKGIN